MLSEYNASELMEKAARYARNARRYLFEEDARSSSLKASPIFERFMEDDDLKELLLIDGFGADAGDFLDSLAGVRSALHSIEKAATRLAAQAGSEMGMRLVEEQSLQNPLDRLGGNDEMAAMKAEMLQFIDAPKAFIPMHERKNFEQEAGCICEQLILHPHEAWYRAKLLKITAGCRALEYEIVWLARSRIQSRMLLISGTSRAFPLVDNEGAVEVVRLPYNWDELCLFEADFYDTEKFLSEEAMDALLGRIHPTPEAMLSYLPYLFEQEYDQERAVTQVIAGYLMGNESVVRLTLAACQMLSMMKSVCSAEFVHAVHDPEKWESSCQIEVITRSGARLTVDIQQNGSFEKLECVFKSELPDRLEVFRPIFDTYTAYIMDRFPEAVSQPRWE